jgi:hypothetical protein
MTEAKLAGTTGHLSMKLLFENLCADGFLRHRSSCFGIHGRCTDARNGGSPPEVF